MLMNSNFKMAVVLGTALATLPIPIRSAELPGFKSELEQLSYSIGMSIGTGLKGDEVEVDVDVLAQGIKDELSGKNLRMTEQEMQQTLQAYRQKMFARQEEKRRQEAAANRVKSEAFLAENKKAPGIKVHEVKLSETNVVELQYKVLKEGTGETPGPKDTVTVNLIGKSMTGQEFENATNRKFILSSVPTPGLSEAIRMMKTGSKWEIFLSPSLAFGDYGLAGRVDPGAAVIFEIELLSSEAPEPVTSDIIKVPSADDLKRGAKIEILKPEDVKRLQETNAGGQ